MSRRLISGFVCCLFVAGCDAGAHPGPAGATSAPAPAAASANAPARSTATLLAMADPGGATAVDGDVRAAQKWVQRVPDSTDKLVELGRAWVVKARHSGDPGFYLNAKACADLVFERDRNNRLGKELMAQVHLNEHRFGEAKDTCEQIFREDPDAFITLGVYSDTLLELGKIDEAIKAADRMVEFKPNLASYVRVSYFKWLRGDVDGALEAAKLAIESSVDPGQPEPRAYALVQTAYFFFQRGDYEGADAGFKKALSEFPSYAPALVGRGRVALATNRPKEAVDFLRQAYKDSPLPETAWRLGDALTAAGDAAGAEQAYADVVKRGRQSDKRTLAHFYAVKNRDIDEALELSRKEIELRPGIYTRDVRAWVLHRAGKHAEAKAEIVEATRLGTPDPQLMYHHGAILIANGDKDAGLKLVKKALEASPSFDPTAAPEAKKLVE